MIKQEDVDRIYEDALLRKAAEGVMTDDEKAMWEMLREKKKEELAIKGIILGEEVAAICNEREEFVEVLERVIGAIKNVSIAYFDIKQQRLAKKDANNLWGEKC